MIRTTTATKLLAGLTFFLLITTFVQASSVAYSTYVGANQNDDIYRIGIDAKGNTYAIVRSPDYPTTAGAYSSVGGFALAKFSPAGALIWSTRFGFTGAPTAMKVDSAGTSYIAGNTSDPNFPTSAGAFQRTPRGTDGFVLKVNSSGGVVGGTLLGGTDADSGASIDSLNGIDVDRRGNIYVGGTTSASDFPVTPGAYDTTYN